MYSKRHDHMLNQFRFPLAFQLRRQTKTREALWNRSGRGVAVKWSDLEQNTCSCSPDPLRSHSGTLQPPLAPSEPSVSSWYESFSGSPTHRKRTKRKKNQTNAAAYGYFSLLFPGKTKTTKRGKKTTAQNDSPAISSRPVGDKHLALAPRQASNAAWARISRLCHLGPANMAYAQYGPQSGRNERATKMGYPFCCSHAK